MADERRNIFLEFYKNIFFIGKNTTAQYPLMLTAEVEKETCERMHLLITLLKRHKSELEALKSILACLISELKVKLLLCCRKAHEGHTYGLGYCFFAMLFQAHTDQHHNPQHFSMESLNIAFKDPELKLQKNRQRFAAFMKSTLLDKGMIEFNSFDENAKFYKPAYSHLLKMVKQVTKNMECCCKDGNVPIPKINTEDYVVQDSLYFIKGSIVGNVLLFQTTTDELRFDQIKPDACIDHSRNIYHDRFRELYNLGINTDLRLCGAIDSNYFDDDKRKINKQLGYGCSVETIEALLFNTAQFVIHENHYYPMIWPSIHRRTNRLEEFYIALADLFVNVVKSCTNYIGLERAPMDQYFNEEFLHNQYEQIVQHSIDFPVKQEIQNIIDETINTLHLFCNSSNNAEYYSQSNTLQIDSANVLSMSNNGLDVLASAVYHHSTATLASMLSNSFTFIEGGFYLTSAYEDLSLTCSSCNTVDPNEVLGLFEPLNADFLLHTLPIHHQLLELMRSFETIQSDVVRVAKIADCLQNIQHFLTCTPLFNANYAITRDAKFDLLNMIISQQNIVLQTNYDFVVGEEEKSDLNLFLRCVRGSKEDINFPYNPARFLDPNHFGYFIVLQLDPYLNDYRFVDSNLFFGITANTQMYRHIPCDVVEKLLSLSDSMLSWLILKDDGKYQRISSFNCLSSFRMQLDIVIQYLFRQFLIIFAWDEYGRWVLNSLTCLEECKRIYDANRNSEAVTTNLFSKFKAQCFEKLYTNLSSFGPFKTTCNCSFFPYEDITNTILELKRTTFQALSMFAFDIYEYFEDFNRAIDTMISVCNVLAMKYSGYKPVVEEVNFKGNIENILKVFLIVLDCPATYGLTMTISRIFEIIAAFSDWVRLQTENEELLEKALKTTVLSSQQLYLLVYKKLVSCNKYSYDTNGQKQNQIRNEIFRRGMYLILHTKSSLNTYKYYECERQTYTARLQTRWQLTIENEASSGHLYAFNNLYNI